MNEKLTILRDNLQNKLKDINLKDSVIRINVNLDVYKANKLKNVAKERGFTTRDQLLRSIIYEWCIKNGV